ncbi:hypothetical protein CHARACLAT_026819 [Characodon lateralis]|uniref:Uncharacterized protein n=1 Tax=Characodon lateralis TaxID=208331 RepID=A0ABU7DK47_9TELE|nr:hypothetical protein [Characodon lateralis]
MALERENAAKLELSRAEERTEKAEAGYDDLKAQALKKASSQKGAQTPTSQVPDLHFPSQQPSRRQTQTTGIQCLQSLPFLNLVQVFNLLPQTLTEVLEVR